MRGIIPTHALREEGDAKPDKKTRKKPISTHALREEGDLRRLREGDHIDTISTHALREEGDVIQSYRRFADGLKDFYPRPPRGGRPAVFFDFPTLRPISTHALREEGDPPSRFCTVAGTHFYPRPPRGGRQQIRRKPRPIYRQHDGSKSKIYKNPRKTRFFPGAVSPKIPLSPPKSGANPAGKPCLLPVRTTQILTAAGHHPATTAGISPHVPPYSDSGSPAGKTAGYRSRGQ